MVKWPDKFRYIKIEQTARKRLPAICNNFYFQGLTQIWRSLERKPAGTVHLFRRVNPA